MLALRATLLLVGLTAFVLFSLGRSSDFGGVRSQLDLVSQSDRIGDPARQHLTGRLAPGSRIGCMGANPDWKDECDYLYYALLPYDVEMIAAGQQPSDPYVLFTANPHASQPPQEQAVSAQGYSLELALPQSVLLLKRNAP